MLHIHVRQPDQRHSLDIELYREAIAAARREVGPDMVIQATTESVGLYKAAEQMAMVRELKPEAISMALRELAPDEAGKAAFADFVGWLQRERIASQIILYDTADTARARAWAQEGVFDARAMSVIFVTGKYAPPTPAAPADLLPLHADCADLFPGLDAMLVRAARDGLRHPRGATGRALPGGLREQSRASRRCAGARQCRNRLRHGWCLARGPA